MELLTKTQGELKCPLQLIAGIDIAGCLDFAQGMMEKFVETTEDDPSYELFKRIDEHLPPQLSAVEHIGATLHDFVTSNGVTQHKEFVTGPNNEFHHILLITRQESDLYLMWKLEKTVRV